MKIYSRENDHIVGADFAPDDGSPPLEPAAPAPWMDLVSPAINETRFVESMLGVSIPT